MTEPLSPAELLDGWNELARASSRAHYQLASNRSAWATSVTVVVVAASTFVGSALFANLSKNNPGDVWRWVLPAVAVATGALAAILRSLGLPELAERHRQAGARWNEFLNWTSRLRTRHAEHGPPDALLQQLERAMNDIVTKSPHVPQRWFEKACLDEIYAKLTAGTPCPPSLLERVGRRMRWSSTS